MKTIKSAKRTVPGKLLVFLLTLSLISVPFPLYAVDISEAKDKTSLTTEAESDVFILAEEPLRRGEFEKHFLLSDGTVLAATYPEAVHYKEGKEWIEIDNSLSFDKGFYRNNNKEFSVCFAHNAKSSDVISIDYEDYTLSWALKINAATKGSDITMSEDAVVVVDNSSAAKDADEATSPLYANKAQSKLYYYDAFGKGSAIDVAYKVTHNKVKEDIIINKKTDFTSLSVLVNSGSLVPKLYEDNRIEFVNSSGDVIFNLCKPYMYDSAGEILYDIAVDINGVKNGYSISYTPNYEWMNAPERVYPIVLDPTVTSSSYQSNYIDTYVHEGDSAGDHTTETKLYFGLRNSQIHRSYLKIIQLPNVPANSLICEAKLWAKVTSGTTTAAPLSIYKVNVPWDINSISFANQPSSTLLEANVPCNLNSSQLDVTFNVINYIALITSTTFVNHGFMIQYTDETYNDYNCIYSSECGNNLRLPLLTIIYYPEYESENNDNIDSATVVDMSFDTGRSSNIRGTLSSASDVDYFKIQPPRHGRVQVMVIFSTGNDHSVSVYNLAQTLIETDQNLFQNSAYYCSFKVTRGNDQNNYIDTHYIRIASNGTSSNYYLSVFYDSEYYDLDWQYPVNGGYRISSPVGYRSFYMNGSQQIDYHQGIDIPGSTSDTIYSVCDGIIIKSGNADDDNAAARSMGNYYVIKANDIDPNTGKHYVIRYMHLSQKYINETNVAVTKGQELGKMGTTGNSTGVHLHIDINDEGKLGSLGIYDVVNPIDFFNDDIHFYGKVFTRD